MTVQISIKKSDERSYKRLVFIKGNTFWRNRVVGPCSADSANSTQGNRSRVQKANGIAMIRTFTYAQNVKIFTVGQGEGLWTQHNGSL